MGSRFGRAGGKPAVKAAVALMMALQAVFCAYAAVRFFDESTLDDPIMAVSLALLGLVFIGGAMFMTGQAIAGVRQGIAGKRVATPEAAESKPPI